MSLKFLTVQRHLRSSLDDHQTVGEDIRLKNRFIDLRRPEIQQKLRFRSKVTSVLRRYLDENGFLDIETPILDSCDT